MEGVNPTNFRNEACAAKYSLDFSHRKVLSGRNIYIDELDEFAVADHF